MDKATGILWANLDYFNHRRGAIENFDEVSGITGWGVPRPAEMIRIVEDTHFSFKVSSRSIKDNKTYWKISTGTADAKQREI